MTHTNICLSLMLGALYEERQFIIVPGETNVTVANQTTPDGKIERFWLECNRGTKIHVFDTFDWEFKSEFDPNNKGSKVPPAIVKLVGGNSTGGATVTQPKAGWDNPSLGSIFAIRNEPPTDVPTAPGTGQNTAQSKKGAIIGGVIGGFCVVALVVSVLIFFRKKRGESSPGESRAAELQEAVHRVELQEIVHRVELQGIDLRPELEDNGNHRVP